MLKKKIYNSDYIKRQFNKYNPPLPEPPKGPFSQFGEDLILKFVFKILKKKNLIQDITYLDIGGNYPYAISNTYFLYQNGCKGVVIEPNPVLYEEFKKARPNDIVLNVGIHFTQNEEKIMPFYMFNHEANGASTFDKKQADSYLKISDVAKNYETIQVEVANINTIIKEYFNDTAPTFISIDVEGIDLEIIKSLDFQKYRPSFWCIETAEPCVGSVLGGKLQDTLDFMKLKNYVIYADTYVNTIFIDEKLMQKLEEKQKVC